MDRNISAFNFLFNYSIGTLWYIKEELWEKRIHSSENYNSDRYWHPGLSIRRTRIVDSYELVPMLHGTSRSSRRNSIVVKGITEHAGENKETFFGRLFAPIQPADMLFDKKNISKNRHKQTITNQEMKQLESWMKSKGL